MIGCWCKLGFFSHQDRIWPTSPADTPHPNSVADQTHQIYHIYRQTRNLHILKIPPQFIKLHIRSDSMNALQATKMSTKYILCHSAPKARMVVHVNSRHSWFIDPEMQCVRLFLSHHALLVCVRGRVRISDYKTNHLRTSQVWIINDNRLQVSTPRNLNSSFIARRLYYPSHHSNSNSKLFQPNNWSPSWVSQQRRWWCYSSEISLVLHRYIDISILSVQRWKWYINISKCKVSIQLNDTAAMAEASFPVFRSYFTQLLYHKM